MVSDEKVYMLARRKISQRSVIFGSRVKKHLNSYLQKLFHERISLLLIALIFFRFSIFSLNIILSPPYAYPDDMWIHISWIKYYESLLANHPLSAPSGSVGIYSTFFGYHLILGMFSLLLPFQAYEIYFIFGFVMQPIAVFLTYKVLVLITKRIDLAIILTFLRFSIPSSPGISGWLYPTPQNFVILLFFGYLILLSKPKNKFYSIINVFIISLMYLSHISTPIFLLLFLPLLYHSFPKTTKKKILLESLLGPFIVVILNQILSISNAYYKFYVFPIIKVIEKIIQVDFVFIFPSEFLVLSLLCLGIFWLLGWFFFFYHTRINDKNRQIFLKVVDFLSGISILVLVAIYYLQDIFLQSSLFLNYVTFERLFPMPLHLLVKTGFLFPLFGFLVIYQFSKKSKENQTEKLLISPHHFGFLAPAILVIICIAIGEMVDSRRLLYYVIIFMPFSFSIWAKKLVKIKYYLLDMKFREKQNLLIAILTIVVFSFAGVSEVYYNHRIGYPGAFPYEISDFLVENDIDSEVVLTFDSFVANFFYSHGIFISYVYYYSIGSSNPELFNMTIFKEFFEDNNYHYLVLIINQKPHNQFLASNFENFEVLVGKGTPLRLISVVSN